MKNTALLTLSLVVFGAGVGCSTFHSHDKSAAAKPLAKGSAAKKADAAKADPVAPTAATPASAQTQNPTADKPAQPAVHPEVSVPAPLPPNPHPFAGLLPHLKKHEVKHNALLDQPAAPLGNRAEKLGNVLRAIGHDYSITFIIPRDIDATTFSFDYAGGGTVRDLLTTVTANAGAYFEDDGGSIVRIKRLKTVIYYIEYPSVVRTSEASSSITVSGGSGGGNGYGNGYTGIPTAATATNPTLAQGVTGRTGMDQNTFTLNKENNGDIWADISSAISSSLDDKAGEKFSLEKRSGIARVTASPDRQQEIKEFIDALNRRINQQVHISVKILEVTLRNEYNVGVDWSQVATHIGGGLNLEGLPALGSLAITATTSGATLVGPQPPNPSTQAGLSFGKLHALVKALEEQGSVRSTSNPEVSTLTNQTAYIKVGQDQPFYSATQSTNLVTPTVTTGTSTITQTSYGERTQTFGTILEVTPHVAEDGLITLDVQPVITRYVGEKFSPDNLRSDAITEIEAAATVYQLYNGETGLLGGFIYDNTTRNENGVPGLRKIKVIGKAFETDGKSSEHSEVIILITAWIGSHGTQNPSELAEVR